MIAMSYTNIMNYYMILMNWKLLIVVEEQSATIKSLILFNQRTCLKQFLFANYICLLLISSAFRTLKEIVLLILINIFVFPNGSLMNIFEVVTVVKTVVGV